MTVSTDQLPSWREVPAKQAIVEFVAAVTDPDAPDFVPERDRAAVFDNDGALWTEQPAYAQLVFAIDRDPILGSGTDQILATAADQKWTVIDMAADWANVHAAS
jgi:hypothetical protein